MARVALSASAKASALCPAHVSSLLQWWGRFHTLRLIKPPQATLHVGLVVRPGQWASTDLLNPHPAPLLPADSRVRTGGPRHGTKGRWPRGWACVTRRTCGKGLCWTRGSLPGARVAEDTEAQSFPTTCPDAGHPGPCALLLGLTRIHTQHGSYHTILTSHPSYL